MRPAATHANGKVRRFVVVETMVKSYSHMGWEQDQLEGNDKKKVMKHDTTFRYKKKDLKSCTNLMSASGLC